MAYKHKKLNGNSHKLKKKRKKKNFKSRDNHFIGNLLIKKEIMKMTKNNSLFCNLYIFFYLNKIIFLFFLLEKIK